MHQVINLFCGAAYMHQRIGSALFRIIAYRLFGTKPLSKLKLCCIIVHWTLRNKLQWKFNQNTKFFIHENASKYIVRGMAAILSRMRWVKLASWWVHVMHSSIYRIFSLALGNRMTISIRSENLISIYCVIRILLKYLAHMMQRSNDYL